MKRIPLFLVVAALATACGSSSEPAGPTGGTTPSGEEPAAGYEGTWGLTSGRGPDGEVPLVDGAPITLVIDGENISGSAACNLYGGDVTIEGSSFEMTGGSMTEIGCAPDIAESEQRYIDTLMIVDTIERSGNSMMLTGPEAELTYEFLPPPPTASLVDTTWRLEALIHGRGPDGVVSSVTAPADLLLTGDGKVSGSTGCRDIAGEWVESGNEIRFTRLSTEGTCPSELEEQDDQVVGVLGDGFTAEIEDQTLTVMAARGDSGLLYKADQE